MTLNVQCGSQCFPSQAILILLDCLFKNKGKTVHIPNGYARKFIKLYNIYYIYMCVVILHTLENDNNN
jgi:hypothetical protein